MRRAQDNLLDLQQKLRDLQNQFEQEIKTLQIQSGFVQPEILKNQLKPRKSDILVQWFGLAWIPCIVESGGLATPAF